MPRSSKPPDTCKWGGPKWQGILQLLQKIIEVQLYMVSSLSSVLPTSQVFTSGYVNTETILHFFYKITNERGTKTVFTYAHVKWFYGQSERAYYLNYFIKKYEAFSRNWIWLDKFTSYVIKMVEVFYISCLFFCDLMWIFKEI